MNKNIKLAVAGAVLALSATAANAGIIIPAGDWTVDINGNVNSFYTRTKLSGNMFVAGETANCAEVAALTNVPPAVFAKAPPVC